MLFSVSAVASEFFATVLFAFFGGLAPPQYAAVANGLALTVLVYCAVSQSGGHLNPNVTTALVLTGHTSVLQGACYVVAQLAGGIVGAGISEGFVGGVGCFAPAPGVSHLQLWGWETIMTVLLIVTVYEVAVVQKGASNIGPLVIGLSLLTAALAGGPFTGAALNFARVLGPAVIHGCAWSTVWIYFLAHVTAIAISVAWGFFVCPVGPYFNHLRDVKFSHFIPATPYSTASSPTVPYTTLSSNDTSLPPYARFTSQRQNMSATDHHKLSQKAAPNGQEF